MRFQTGKLEMQARCPHSSRSKEIIRGQKTGDTVCNDCGEAFAPGEMIVSPDFRRGMIVTPHALLIALSINDNLSLSKNVNNHDYIYDWALVDKVSGKMIIPVAADVAATCLGSGYVTTGL